MKDLNTRPSLREIMFAASLLGSSRLGRVVLNNFLKLLEDPTGNTHALNIEETRALFTLLHGANTFDVTTPKYIKQSIETEGTLLH